MYVIHIKCIKRGNTNINDSKNVSVSKANSPKNKNCE